MRAFANACTYIHTTIPDRIANVKLRMQAMLYYDIRGRFNSWAFFQLRQFVQYKAALAGVLLVLVPAAYTSQMCHCCLHIGARKGKRFPCTNPACGWAGDADFNGAKNIQTLGLQGSLPRGPSLHSLWPQEQGSQKAHVA